jgi:hypothetical protein
LFEAIYVLNAIDGIVTFGSQGACWGDPAETAFCYWLAAVADPGFDLGEEFGRSAKRVDPLKP